MNKIYRVFNNESLNSVAVGYLINEDDNSYKVRVQNGTHTKVKEFSKINHTVKSIWDEDSGDRYQLNIKDAHGKKSTIELSKTCFGGCG